MKSDAKAAEPSLEFEGASVEINHQPDDRKNESLYLKRDFYLTDRPSLIVTGRFFAAHDCWLFRPGVWIWKKTGIRQPC